MAIDLQCPACGERLRVADDSAGKDAKCPKCQTVFPVPAAAAATGGGAPVDDAAPEPRRAEPVASPVTSPVASSSTQMWQMKTPAGQSYGPVSRQELDSWAAEGRISADYQLLAVGSDQWQWASDVFPKLAPGGGSNVDVNSYSSPSAASGGRRLRPHRGGMILVFGILAFAVCVVFGPIAWVMGNTDLREMRMGRMDPGGQGITQAGMICGMISTILLIISVLLFIPLIVCAGLG